MKIYSQHCCSRRHRTYRAFISCAFPGAVVFGEGPYALIARYGDYPRISLYPTEAAVNEAKQHALYDDPRCRNGLEIVHIAEPDAWVKVVPPWIARRRKKRR